MGICLPMSEFERWIQLSEITIAACFSASSLLWSFKRDILMDYLQI